MMRDRGEFRQTGCRIAVAVVLAVAAVAALRAQSPARGVTLAIELPDNPTIGARLFVEKGCVRCHGLTGDEIHVGPDLGRLRFRGTVMDLAGSFWNHAPAMRERMLDMKIQPPTLTSHEMADLVAFLTTYRYYLTEVGQAANPVAGKTVFADKACGRCHGVGRDFGKSAPDLSRYRGGYSAISLAQTMWNHGGEMAVDMRRQGVPWPKFQGLEMGDLLAFLQLGATASAGERAYVEPGSPRRGRELFSSKFCIDCHAVAGVGGRGGPDLGRRGREFVGSISSLAGLMWNHSQAMSAELSRRSLSVTFSGQEMADILAYVFFVNYASVPANPELGGAIFAKKCSPCHSVGEGERVGPDLGIAANLDEPLAVVAALWDHAPKMERELRIRSLAWPRLEVGEAADLTAFLLSRRPGASAARTKPR
jgi:cytochrome c2